VLIEEGPIVGTVAGQTWGRFLYNGGPIVTMQFTIRTANGSLRGHGLGRLNNTDSASPSFAGPLAITSGNGRYAHVTGRGKVYGVFYRNSGKLILQPVGQLNY
jgi:hypothetical protein